MYHAGYLRCDGAFQEMFGVNRVATTLLAAVSAVAIGGAAFSDQGKPSETRSFVVASIFMPAVPVDNKSCPMESKSGVEVFLDTLPPQERAKYSDPAKARELGALMAKTLGFKRSDGNLPITADNIDKVRRSAGIPPGKGALVSYPTSHLAYDTCTNPDDFPSQARGNQEYLGKIAYGMNLDGKVGKRDFTGPDGEVGVDNGWYRAMACSRISRSTGEPRVGDNVLVSQASPMLIEVTGVDDERNDNDVEVNVYSSVDAMELGANGRALAGASYHPDPRPALTSRVKGRIVDGILTTDNFDLRFRYHESIIDAQLTMRSARIRATIKPDGSIEGGIYGYHTLASLEEEYAQSSTIGATLMSCPGQINALRAFADGFPDPKTHRNTAISSMYRFKGVSAFVVHGPEKGRRQ